MAADVVVPHFRGASTHVLELARHLTNRGHKVCIISRRMDWGQPKSDDLDGVAVHRIFRGIVCPTPFSTYRDLGRNLESPRDLWHRLYATYLYSLYPIYAGLVASRIVREQDVDVIIERETSFGAGAVASTLTGRPMVLEVIGPRTSKYSIQVAKKVVAYSERMAGSVAKQKLELVTAAVNVELFKPDRERGRSIRNQHGLRDSPVVGYVGTFAEWHGIEDLIRCSRRILERYPETRFLMVGPYSEWAKEASVRNGVSDAYIFTGPVRYEDVSGYMNAADILVAPYDPAKSDDRRRFGIGSPLKIFEYMACGKPVVASSLEPIREIISCGSNGLLTPPGDPDSLGEAIIFLLENPAVAQDIGKRALADVRSRYSWYDVAKRFEGIMGKILNGGSKPA